jgi:hypothetical protein
MKRQKENQWLPATPLPILKEREFENLPLIDLAILVFVHTPMW